MNLLTLLGGTATGALAAALTLQIAPGPRVKANLKGVRLSNTGVMLNRRLYIPLNDVAKVLKISPAVSVAQSGGSAFNVIAGKNLILNGDFESSPGIFEVTDTKLFPVFAWTATDGACLGRYELPDTAIYETRRPPDCNDQYFLGGKLGRTPTLTQTINLAAYQTEIGANKVAFRASAYLGGFATQPDACKMTLAFLDSAGKVVASQSVDGPTPKERKNFAQFLKRELVGKVPSSAKSAKISLVASGDPSGWVDGYADNVELILEPAK